MFKIKVIDDHHRTFYCQNGESLLDALQRHDVKIPFACRGGGCGLCKVKIETGEFERGPSSKEVLPDEERELNYTLACKTYPKSGIQVRIGID
ncbi:2Fe-2S iron-sulfur cluster-binding protein [Thermoactinomyces mirandus]|uniref:2Fe-2S iron-sulfur cluster binding domain-containing protein n=1 Tax=Thermoactinomyces mirandus TaxID=2756294 RepID=A0A7W1XQN1_9BACL|nr:2Fe-2S iron-sulfur cluster binding domain-containing protein [Thermoactinomyces mirandus]MBA4601397.1 2Fe-2S iron-sulfur cluster binding domain-containing protein [Thermoactinomyces mirandus]